jgi:hypothetical protein
VDAEGIATPGRDLAARREGGIMPGLAVTSPSSNPTHRVLSADTARGGEYLDLLKWAQPPIPSHSRLAARFAAVRSYRYALTGQADRAAAEALDARAIQQQTSPGVVKLTPRPTLTARRPRCAATSLTGPGCPSMSPRPASQPPGRVAVTGIGPARSLSKAAASGRQADQLLGGIFVVGG